ncbi:MAG TPA: hypothetical protein VH877_03665 [Polyangia bacterium]|jgi:hypothetical protein|nr:hypothetical protein [Polyangia bacterium]
MAEVNLFDAFGRQFLLPLVAGGQLRVGAPLGERGLTRLVEAAREPGHDVQLEAAIGEARAETAATLLVDPIAPQIDVATLRLAVALHDLLFFLHPAAAGPLVRDRRLEQVAEYAAELARLPATTDADDLVARHTVLHLFPELGRNDVRVTFWAGRREFHGEEPPGRLLAWRNLRRVREERWRVNCFSEAAAHPLGGAVVRALLDGSPLTDLLHPLRAEPKFELGRAASVLVEPQVCRLVAYHLLAQGLDRVGSTLGQAMLVELERPGTWRARFVLAFASHLHLCQALASREAGGGGGARRHGMPGDLPLRDFYGIYAALARLTPELAAPSDVRRDPRLMARVNEYAANCEAICGTNRTTELRSLIARAIGEVPLVAGTG